MTVRKKRKSMNPPSPERIETIYKDMRELTEECPDEELKQWALKVSDYLAQNIGTSTAVAFFFAVFGIEEQRIGTPKDCYTRGVTFLQSLVIDIAADYFPRTIQ